MLSTPILFLIYNRPEMTFKVFNAIRLARPKYLFIAADGPKQNKADDELLCKQSRSILNLVDWDCEVKTLFRKQNLGCGIAVSEAITWFFSFVENGIILEDDCLPDATFFTFCQQLLEKYKDCPQISTISANNYQLKYKHKASYYFSIYSHIWGWATWRRTWDLYRYEINDYNKSILMKHIKNKEEILYWDNIYKNIDKFKQINTWDYQLQYMNFKHNMMSIVPSVNLVRNLGFFEGTHLISDIPTYHYKIRYGSIHEIIYENNIAIDTKADEFFFNNMLSTNTNIFQRAKGILRRVVSKLKKS